MALSACFSLQRGGGGQKRTVLLEVILAGGDLLQGDELEAGGCQHTHAQSGTHKEARDLGAWGLPYPRASKRPMMVPTSPRCGGLA